MQVAVHFYSYFKELTGCPSASVEVPAAASIEQLLQILFSRYPKIEPMKKSMLVAVGVEYQPKEYVLKPDEEVSLFPPVQGG
jgi:molybdopterin converting factor small subunit